MAKNSAYKYKKLGFKSFVNKKYKDSLNFFSLSKNIKPLDQETELGILLSSLAFDLEDEAHAIYEFYNAAKLLDTKNVYEMISTLIDSVEEGMPLDDESNITFSFDEEIENEKGIIYEDFKNLVNDSQSFEKIFRNILFSTKVIITKKDDFFEFVENLILSGYIDMALNYIDNASLLFPSDQKIRELLNMINKIEHLEISDK